MESKIEINGLNIAVKEAGTGPDMVLIHGIFATKEIFNYHDLIEVVDCEFILAIHWLNSLRY